MQCMHAWCIDVIPCITVYQQEANARHLSLTLHMPLGNAHMDCVVELQLLCGSELSACNRALQKCQHAVTAVM
jgi:hypothetical protein